MDSNECGMRNAECGTAECGISNACPERSRRAECAEGVLSEGNESKGGTKRLTVLLLLFPLVLCSTCDNDELTEDWALHAFGTAGEPPEDTWTDSSSGLTWQVTPTGGTMGWSAAKSHCAGLSLAGGGWHLPTIGEFRTLIRGCPGTVTGGACGVTDGCLNSSCNDDGGCWDCSSGDGPADGCYWPDEMQGTCSWYWSSSPVEDHGGLAWGVNFDYGNVTYVGVDPGRYVRCAR